MGLDDALFDEIQDELRYQFAADSLIFPAGRIAIAQALNHARRLVTGQGRSRVLVVATDSLVTWPTLSEYEEQARLLAGENMDGFVPGEGAGAILLGIGSEGRTTCAGIGIATETAHIRAGMPLKGIGLAGAIRAALADANREMHEMAFRIADIAGEQYYFKEAALALARTLRGRKESFDLWHPADCIGETGATAGIVMLAIADAACRKSYAPGAPILLHLSSDDGQRAALVIEY
jgi:3-oxoacyl-[acyl-carrier-protein] synthase-1